MDTPALIRNWCIRLPCYIDAAFRGGYAVAVADFNKDDKPDVIANSLSVQDVASYENLGMK